MAAHATCSRRQRPTPTTRKAPARPTSTPSCVVCSRMVRSRSSSCRPTPTAQGTRGIRSSVPRTGSGWRSARSQCLAGGSGHSATEGSTKSAKKVKGAGFRECTLLCTLRKGAAKRAHIKACSLHTLHTLRTLRRGWMRRRFEAQNIAGHAHRFPVGGSCCLVGGTQADCWHGRTSGQAAKENGVCGLLLAFVGAHGGRGGSGFYSLPKLNRAGAQISVLAKWRGGGVTWSDRNQKRRKVCSWRGKT